MPRFPSELCPHVVPLTRSIGAPWAPLMPSRTGSGSRAAEHFQTSDNPTDWDPYGGGDNLHLRPSNQAGPLPSDPAIGSIVVTPSCLWNIAGPSGWEQGGWPTVVKGPSGGRYYQFGFQTPGQAAWSTGPQVRLSLPSVPPPMPFLGGSQ